MSELCVKLNSLELTEGIDYEVNGNTVKMINPNLYTQEELENGIKKEVTISYIVSNCNEFGISKSYFKYLKRVNNRNKLHKKLKKLGR